MKHLLLSALVILALTGCSKKADDTPTPATTYGASWTVDNTNYTDASSSGNVVSGMLALAFAKVVSNSESYILALNIPASAAGTYTLASGSNPGNYAVTANGTRTTYFITGGTVTISTYSATEIIGTFSVTGSTSATPSTTKTITNGKFAVKR